MTPKDLLARKYAALCQQLGDSQVKLDQLTQFISDLKSQIKDLDKHFALLQEAERLPTSSEQK